MTETEFEILAADRGHGGQRVVDFAPEQRPDLHTHAWSTLLLVTHGTLTMAYANRSIDLQPGDWCHVDADVMHSERTGADGATAILATRAV